MKMETKGKQVVLHLYTYIRQNRPWETKDCNKRQRRKLHNDQGIIQEDIAVVKVYAHSIEAPKFIK